MGKANCIIVDLDGTLCDASHRVHHLQQKPKNWKEFYTGMANDALIKAVDLIIEMAQHRGLSIVFLTGRPEEHRQLTQDWLERNSIVYSRLFMRATGDFRNDDIVKLEIYRRDIEPYFNVRFALEDRTRVVKMWRSIGIPCFQVAEGDF